MAIPHPSASDGRIVQAYSQVSDTAADSGDNTLVAAPGANARLVIKEFVIQNESAIETTALLKGGSTTHWRCKLAANDAVALSFAVGEEWRLGANEALVLNLDGANSHGYSVRYFIESV